MAVRCGLFSYFYARVAHLYHARPAPLLYRLRYCTVERESRVRASSASSDVGAATSRHVRRADVVTPTRHSHTDGITRLTGSRSRAAQPDPERPRTRATPTGARHAPAPHGGTTRLARTARIILGESPDEMISPPSLATGPHSPRAHPTPSGHASTTFRRACGATAVREQCMSSAFLARRSCDLVLLALVLAPGGEPDGPHATCLAIIRRRP